VLSFEPTVKKCANGSNYVGLNINVPNDIVKKNGEFVPKPCFLRVNWFPSSMDVVPQMVAGDEIHVAGSLEMFSKKTDEDKFEKSIVIAASSITVLAQKSSVPAPSQEDVEKAMNILQAAAQCRTASEANAVVAASKTEEDLPF
jgi:hypothetical protein